MAWDQARVDRRLCGSFPLLMEVGLVPGACVFIEDTYGESPPAHCMQHFGRRFVSRFCRRRASAFKYVPHLLMSAVCTLCICEGKRGAVAMSEK